MCPTFYTFTLVQILKPEQNTAAIILCFPNAMQLSEQFQGRLEEECLREGEREREREGGDIERERGLGCLCSALALCMYV